MKNVVKHHNLLFSTLSEITSLIAAGHDRTIIIEKLLDCSLVVLNAERVHLLQMERNRIVKHTKARRGEGSSRAGPVNSPAPGLRAWRKPGYGWPTGL